MYLPHNSSSPLVGIKRREMKSYIHTKTCIQMFLAALFIIVKNWKPPKCSSVGQQIYCGTIDSHWVLIINRNGSVLHTAT